MNLRERIARAGATLDGERVLAILAGDVPFCPSCGKAATELIEASRWRKSLGGRLLVQRFRRWTERWLCAPCNLSFTRRRQERVQ